MRDIAGDQAGVLRVGAVYMHNRAIIPPVVKVMQCDCPSIIAKLIEDRNSQIQQWLANGDLDLAVADFAGKPADIELVGSYNERMASVLAQSLWMNSAATSGATNNQVDVIRTTPDERAITAGDLSSLERYLLLLGSPQDIDGCITDPSFRRAGFEPKVIARSDNVLTLLELCCYGMDACLCPERLPPALFDGEWLRTLRVLNYGPDTAYTVQFGVSATSHRWSATDDFIRCVREVTTGVPQ